MKISTVAKKNAEKFFRILVTSFQAIFCVYILHVHKPSFWPISWKTYKEPALIPVVHISLSHAQLNQCFEIVRYDKDRVYYYFLTMTNAILITIALTLMCCKSQYTMSVHYIQNTRRALKTNQ